MTPYSFIWKWINELPWALVQFFQIRGQNGQMPDNSTIGGDVLASVSQVCRASQLQHMSVLIYSADCEYSSKVELTCVKKNNLHPVCALIVYSITSQRSMAPEKFALVINSGTNDPVNDLAGLRVKAVCWHKLQYTEPSCTVLSGATNLFTNMC